jgi:hypothetical protein
MRRGQATLLAAAALCTLPACNDHPLDPVEYESLSQIEAPVDLVANRNVDVLFVIDNSGSMGEEQATLAANFERFISVLERENVRADYRIGITTTDAGLCAGSTPEAGKLVLSSCRSRTQDFVFNGDDPVDATDAACLSICPEQWADIETLPTQIEEDGPSAPRPWIENIGGVTNLPDGLTTTQAFQCLGPQGVNGCGFEEHLEAMRLAITRANTDSESSYGFLRDDALLAIVYVTDEEDCSINKDFTDVFSPNGDRTFWSDPTAGNATSAVCWNAGVECTGSGSDYACRSANIGIDGQPVDDSVADDEAVVRPLSRYVQFVQAIEDAKQQRGKDDRDVLVAVIGGVGDDGEPTYSDSTADAKFVGDFGVGPGCQSDAGRAVPPVRLTEFADDFAVDDQQNMFSVCNPDYSEALEQIAETLAKQVRPPCMTSCVGDFDPVSDVLDPKCTLEQHAVDGDGRLQRSPVPPCSADGSLPSDDVDVCYVAKVDGALDANEQPVFLTETTMDDMSPACRTEGWNLEFDVVRREGTKTPGGTSVKATCQLSQQRAIDCPLLD